MERWLVYQKKNLEYEIICPKCGTSFSSARIIARKRCEACGADICDRDVIYNIGSSGELIESELKDDRNQSAKEQHYQITKKALQVLSSFCSKIRKIVFSTG